jgi:hypothetical protein
MISTKNESLKSWIDSSRDIISKKIEALSKLSNEKPAAEMFLQTGRLLMLDEIAREFIHNAPESREV